MVLAARLSMIFDPYTNVATEWVKNFRAEPKAEDPFKALVQVLRSQAEYHRMIKDETGAALCEWHAKLVEDCVEAIRNAEVDYDQAEAISTWERGTVKNKKAELDEACGPASRGKVKVGSLPLKALTYPGVHALRAVDHFEAMKVNNRHTSHEGKADEEWAHGAVQTARKTRR